MLWLFFERVIQVLIGILITGLFAHSLNTKGYGIYQYASSIISVVMSLTYICGSEVIVPKLVTDRSSKTFSILYNAFIIRFVFSFVIFIGLIIYLYYSKYPGELKQLIGLWSLVLLVNEPFAVIRSWMESNTYIKPNVIIRISSLFIKLLLVYLFYILSLSIIWIGVIFFMEALSMSVGQYLYFNSSFKQVRQYQIDREVVFTLIRSGVVFWVGIVFMFFFTKIDKIILREFVSYSDLGLYTAAMSFTDQLNAIAPILSVSFAPLYIYKESNYAKATQNTLRIVAMLIVSSILLSVSVALLSDLIVKFILGDAFVQSANILLHSVWVCIIVFADSGFSLMLYRDRAYPFIILKWAVAFFASGLVLLIWVSSINVYAGILSVYVGYASSMLVSVYYIFIFRRPKQGYF